MLEAQMSARKGGGGKEGGKGKGKNKKEPKQTRNAGGVDNYGNEVLKGEKKSKVWLTKIQEEKATAASAPTAESLAKAEEARKKFTRVDAFEGMFDCFAMDFPCDVYWDGRVYRSGTHAILAAQYPKAVLDIEEATTAEAARKAVGGETEVDAWPSLRLKAMERIMRDKFRRSADFRKRLQDTGDRELLWENAEDAFWGVTNGRGQNHLGRVLMEIRSSMQNDTEWETWLFVCCEMESDAMHRPPVELVEQKCDEGGKQLERRMHRLTGSAYYKFGKLPAGAIQAMHPSVSREHAMLIHTRSWIAQKTGGLALIDMGSKAGTSISGRTLPHAWTMEPLKNGDTIKLGVSTRDYVFNADLKSQIRQLEMQEAALMKEVKIIDIDAANPIEAAKRVAREEATVFVGNLENETEKADILGLFEDCGHVEEVRFPGPDGTKATRGIAFVIFDTTLAARRSVGLSGETFKGKKIRVAPANENRSSKGDGKGDSKGKDRDDGDSKGKGKNKDGDSKGKGKGKGKDRDGDIDNGRDRRDERRPSPPGGGGSRQLVEERRRDRSNSSRSRGKRREARHSQQDEKLVAAKAAAERVEARACAEERQSRRASPSKSEERTWDRRGEKKQQRSQSRERRSPEAERRQRSNSGPRRAATKRKVTDEGRPPEKQSKQQRYRSVSLSASSASFPVPQTQRRKKNKS